MDSEIKLKSCPFCGGEAILKSRVTNYFAARYFVMCEQCHAESKNCRDMENAIEAWNRRADRTGEWLEDEYGYCRCSRCGYEHDDPETTTPYCPECGARMNGMTEASYEEKTT